MNFPSRLHALAAFLSLGCVAAAFVAGVQHQPGLLTVALLLAGMVVALGPAWRTGDAERADAYAHKLRASRK